MEDPGHELAAAAHPKFDKDILEVVLDGVGRDPHLAAAVCAAVHPAAPGRARAGAGEALDPLFRSSWRGLPQAGAGGGMAGGV